MSGHGPGSGAPQPRQQRSLEDAVRDSVERYLPKDTSWSVSEAVTNPAMLGVLLLSLAYLGVLADVTDVVGGTGLMVAEILVVLLVGVAVAPRFEARTALVGTAALLAAGLTVYYFSIPESQRALIDIGTVLRDFIALLTGLSVYRLLNAQIWVLTVLPAPLFGSWLLALRGRYSLSVLVGGSVLGLFVLTGDAGITTTLVGVVGASAAVGLSELAPRDAVSIQWDTVILVVTAMVVLSASVSLVPGGSARPAFIGDATPTLESNLVDNQENVGIVGSIRLSPEVRFTIQSEQKAYWKVGSYDRYTGDGWVRTGDASQYDGRLADPPGASRTVEQTVTAKTPLNSMPAAWKPVEVQGAVARATLVTEQEGLRAATAIDENESYTVVSEVPQHSPGQLRQTGTNYPDRVEERYLALPDSTPDRVGERTDEVVADADNPYDTAVAIEQYLESEKRYSLNVRKPEGNIADSFLFEMDAGYCTYFATTMVTMLRTQGIPARFVTGYTPGERVAEDKWVVRGLDAHAWVEVYFEGVGWVAFDPTPGAARSVAEDQRVAEAREGGAEGVDTTESGPGEWTPTEAPTATPGETTASNDTGGGGAIEFGRTPNIQPEGDTNGTVGTLGDFTATPGDGEDQGPLLPSREQLGYGFAFLLGGVAASRRFGIDKRLYRFVWLRYQPREGPVEDVERAYDRLEALLTSRYGPRRRGETVSDYVDRLVVDDARVNLTVRRYEQAHYGGTVTAAAADEAVAAVDGVVAETTPVIGRLRG